MRSFFIVSLKLFILNITENILKKYKVPILFFSLEIVSSIITLYKHTTFFINTGRHNVFMIARGDIFIFVDGGPPPRFTMPVVSDETCPREY